MKILFVTHRYPPRTGGVETHVREIATHLVERGHEVTVFSADAGIDVSSESTDEKVRVRRFRSFSPGGTFYVAPGIARAVRRAAPDIVHAHNYHSLPILFAAMGIGDARFVVTTHYHGASASGFRDRLLSLYRPLGRWVLQRADEVVAVSEWEADRLREDFGVEATVIPNGLNVERFENATPEERGRPYLLCVGRLEDYKGVQHAIRALPELPKYDLLVAGAGEYREELEQIARESGVSERVEFLGYVDDQRLPGLYAGATAYLLLSKFEAYGMTVGEALASGTPCVVRTGSALDDWRTNPGVVGIPDSEPGSVAQAVADIRNVDTDETKVMSWDAVVDEIEGRY